MSLTMLGIGEKARIAGLSGSPHLKRYLTEIGLVLGKRVEILQSTFGNSMIIALEGMRLAIDRRMAHHVQIDLET